MDKVALITGINGQDGSYLAEFLLEKNYYVWGTIRRSSIINTERIDNIFDNPKINIKYGDLTDNVNILNILLDIKNTYPNLEILEIYNLAAMSHVKVSFELPEYTGNVDAIGVVRILESIRICGIPHSKIRFYQASTSELYGKVIETPQNESTPFNPRSPYAVAKLYGYWITRNYREAYGLFASNGILFNHESPRRTHNFVTKKITLGLQKILTGKENSITLGNIDSYRDWGHAKDYVIAMWMILQHDKPDDFVISTGETHTVREFVETAFKLKNIQIKWKGSGVDEIGYDELTGKELIFVSSKYFRPTEVDYLLGDSTKARTVLGWKPVYNFDSLIKEMVEYDCS